MTQIFHGKNSWTGHRSIQNKIQYMDGTGLRFESWKMENHTQNASQHHSYCFLKEIWILKFGCSQKSHTNDNTKLSSKLSSSRAGWFEMYTFEQYLPPGKIKPQWPHDKGFHPCFCFLFLMLTVHRYQKHILHQHCISYEKPTVMVGTVFISNQQ